MPSAPLLLDPDTLKHAIPPTYLERGRRYLNERRVLSVDQDAARGRVTGRVRGSGGRIYQCIVQLGQHADGSLMVVGQCSCPVGYNCKHVAAVLLSLGARQAGGAAPSAASGGAPVLPHQLSTWLDQIERATASPSEEAHRLVYILDLEEVYGTTRTTVRAAKVRLLLTGEYGKPQDFNILGQSRAAFVAPEDQRIMALVAVGRGGGTGTSARLDDLTGADVMQAIARTGRGYFRTTDGPALRDAGPLDGRLVWRLGDDAQFRVVLETDRQGLLLLPMTPPWYLDPQSGDCGPLRTGLADREAGALAAAPVVAPETAEALAEVARVRLKGRSVSLPTRPERRHSGKQRPVPRLRLRSVDLAASSVGRYWGIQRPPEWSHHAVLDFDYGGAWVDPRDRVPVLRRVEQGVLVEIERDPDAERAAIGLLEGLGFRRTTEASDADGLWLERVEPETWLDFMQDGLADLIAQGWGIEIDDGFHFRIAEIGDWEMDIAEGEGGNWLHLGLGVEVDGQRVDLLPLLVELIGRYQVDLSPRALAAMDAETRLQLRLPDGRLILMPVQRLRPILSTLIELYDPEGPLGGQPGSKGRLRLSRVHAAQLAELEAADPALRWRGGESVREWGRRLRDFRGLEPIAPPVGLAVELRPYQRQGLDWLQFLRAYGLGGVLADDMGLGKTVQTLAHLLIEKESGRAGRPSLVVAPTSLLFNWRREAERFTPALRILSLHGAARHARFASIPEHDLVLTTYPLLPRDLEALAACEFHLLILDEAQNIKNPRSKAAQAARALNARHRLCLTGTPMENHLGELWSLLDFLMPELLGDERRFRRLFRVPIERYGDEVRQDELRRRVSPFLLRRTKEAVAAELPPKSEIVREVPLADDQRDLYETLRLALHEKVREEVARKGLARSGIIILDALLKLRQVCCDPRLVSLESARRVKGSAKLDLLMTLLPDLLAEGRRVLLFSQFTSMLALIEEKLMNNGLREDEDFVKLTGRTRNRDRPVDRFQAGEVPLFLISLKAGGTGLNLTAADTVIHYDPWWNPAAERQATDRAHRIGQDKPVFVYKLLTEGTVEQRVADLQARKQALADAMLAGGGAASGVLSPADLDLLFAPLSED
jgi:superfamily II DNA or RNA helicase